MVFCSASILLGLAGNFTHWKIPHYVWWTDYFLLGYFVGYTGIGAWLATRRYNKSRGEYRKFQTEEIHRLRESGLLDRRERPGMEDILYVASILVSMRALDPKWAANEIALLEKWCEHWGFRIGQPTYIDTPKKIN